MTKYRILNAIKTNVYLFLTILFVACGGGDENTDVAGVIYTPNSTLSTSENTTSTTVTIMLESAPSSAISISLSSSDETEGTISPSVVSFTAENWNVPQTITITGVDDDIVDGDQTYTIITGEIITDDSRYNGFNPPDINVVNSDNDASSITISPTNLSINETGERTSSPFNVSVNSQPSASIEIDITTGDSSEALISQNSGTPNTTLRLVFTETNWSTAQTVIVTSQHDRENDGNQTIQINLSNVTSADPAYSNLPVDDVTVEVVDTDIATANFTPSQDLVTTENLGQASFSVVLTKQPSSNVSFNLSSSNVAEGTIDKTSLTFTPVNFNSAQLVTITGVDDTTFDGTQVYTIVTDAMVSNDPDYNNVNPIDISVSNLDNEEFITINPISNLSTSESGTTANFTVALNVEPTDTVIFDISSSDISEGLLMGGDSPNVAVETITVTFTVADWATPQSITIVGQNDDVEDGNQPYTIQTSQIQSNDQNYFDLDPVDPTISNLDDDTAGFTLGFVDPIIISEDNTTANVDITLSRLPSADVVFEVTSTESDEALIIGGDSPTNPADFVSITFTPTDWMTPQTFTIEGQDDDIVDGDKMFDVTVAIQSSADASFATLDTQTLSVTNTDNELSNIGTTLNKPQTVITSEKGDTTSFTIRLNSKPNGIVNINIKSSDSNEGLILTKQSSTPEIESVISFNEDNWNISQVIALLGQADNIEDGDKDYNVDLIVEDSTTDTTGYKSISIESINSINLDDTSPKCEGSSDTPKTIQLSDLPYNGSVCSTNGSFHKIVGLTNDSHYLLSFKNITAPIFTVVTTEHGENHQCNSENNSTSEILCSVFSGTSGELIINSFNFDDNANFTISTFSSNIPSIEGSRDSPVILDSAVADGFLASTNLSPSYYQLSNLNPSSQYLIYLSDVETEVNLSTFDSADFSQLTCSNHDFQNNLSGPVCIANTNATGNLWININNMTNNATSNVNINYIEYNGENSEGSATNPIIIEFADSMTQFSGKTNGFMPSFYRIDGLEANQFYTVSKHSFDIAYITNEPIQNSLDIECLVYSGNPCNIVADDSGSLFVKILPSQYESKTTDITITIESYDGESSEGSIDSPLELNWENTALTYNGTVGTAESHYHIRNLIPFEYYLLSFSEMHRNTNIQIITNLLKSQFANCSGSEESQCIVKADLFGNVHIKMNALNISQGTGFRLDVSEYSGVLAEGTKNNPLLLTPSGENWVHTGTATNNGSYYTVSGLLQNTVYLLNINLLSNSSIRVSPYAPPKPAELFVCHYDNTEFDVRCLIKTNENGEIATEIDVQGKPITAVYELSLSTYSDIMAQGSEDNPSIIQVNAESDTHNGSVNDFGSFYQYVGLTPNTTYSLELTSTTTSYLSEIDKNESPDLIRCVVSGASNTNDNCYGKSNENGEMLLAIKGKNSPSFGGSFTLVLNKQANLVSEGEYFKPKTISFSNQSITYIGKTGAEINYYSIDNLQANQDYLLTVTDNFSIHNRFNDFTDSNCESYIPDLGEQECLIRANENGKINISIIANSLGTQDFNLSIVTYTGSTSEGTRDNPLELDFANLPTSNTVGLNSSYYVITGLAADTNYNIVFSNMSSKNISPIVYRTQFQSSLACFAREITNDVKQCLATSSSDGKLWINVNGSLTSAGASFDLSASLYDGINSQGSVNDPMNLVYIENQANYNGTVSQKGSFYKIVGLDPTKQYYVKTFNNTDSLFVKIFLNTFTNISLQCQYFVAVNNDSNCLINANPDGEIWISVSAFQSLNGASFELDIAPYNGVNFEGTKAAPFVLNSSTTTLTHSGSTNPLDSYYLISGLQSNSYYVLSLTNMTAELDLGVYSTSDYAASTCAVLNSSLVDESCVGIANNNGNLWVKVEGNLASEGATFELNLTNYSGEISEGSIETPKNIVFDGTSLNYFGKASPIGSFYKMTQLAAETDYTITLSNASDNTGLKVFATPYTNPVICDYGYWESNNKTCVVTSNTEGNVWLNVTAGFAQQGSTFNLTILP